MGGPKLVNEDQVLGAKYSVHAAFAMQQNMVRQMQEQQKAREKFMPIEDRPEEEPTTTMVSEFGRILPFRPDSHKVPTSDELAPNELYARIE